MVYTPIQDKMPTRCYECKDDACNYWTKDSSNETRHAECPLVQFVSREDAQKLILKYVAGVVNFDIDFGVDEVLDKLGFQKVKK